MSSNCYQHRILDSQTPFASIVSPSTFAKFRWSFNICFHVPNITNSVFDLFNFNLFWVILEETLEIVLLRHKSAKVWFNGIRSWESEYKNCTRRRGCPKGSTYFECAWGLLPEPCEKPVTSLTRSERKFLILTRWALFAMYEPNHADATPDMLICVSSLDRSILYLQVSKQHLNPTGPSTPYVVDPCSLGCRFFL